MHRVEAVQGQSPLYYLLVRAVTAALGESEATVRLVGIVAGAALLLAGYLGAAVSWGRRAGAVALVLLAFDPRLVHDAETARPYAFAELGAVIAFAAVGRAVATGAPRWRLAAWGGAVLAAYAHTIFAAALPALAIAALAGDRSRYRVRAVVIDAALAVLALAPLVPQMLALSARRAELAWVSGPLNPGAIGAVLPARLRWIALAGLVAALARRRALGAGRAPLVYAASCATIAPAALLALYASGSNIVDERYIALGALGATLAAAWAIAALPRPLAAVALAAATLLAVRGYHERWEAWPHEWREAAAELRAQEPAPRDTVVFWSGFIEANVLVDPRRATPELLGFLASPLDDQPGAAPLAAKLVPLCFRSNWSRADLHAFFDERVGPVLDASGRVFLVAPPKMSEAFERWLLDRSHGTFERAARSRTYDAAGAISTYRHR